MRYKTVIEVICEAPDRDEAIHSAGEYLSGKGLYDVGIKFTTKPLRSHLIVKTGLGLMGLFVVTCVLMLLR